MNNYDCYSSPPVYGHFPVSSRPRSRRAVLLVIHAARLGEQMSSFSRTHRELCFSMVGFRWVESVVCMPDTRWQSKSSLFIAPTYIPNDDVILFIPLYHMAQAGSLLFGYTLIFFDCWYHCSSYLLLLCGYLTYWWKSSQCLFNEIKVSAGSAVWRWD